MPTYRVLVTDITCYGSLYCIAGWDLDRERMIRPEPPETNPSFEASRFWCSSYVGMGRIFSIGNVVQFDAATPPASFPFPHATEDRIVTSRIYCINQVAESNIPDIVADGTALSLDDVFEEELSRASSGKAYVLAGAQTRSLGAIEIPSNQIRFFEDTNGAGKKRLRAKLLQSGVEYDLSVPADAARSAFIANGVDALASSVADSDLIHVRVGLCRPFAAMPDKCYAQVNGVYFL